MRGVLVVSGLALMALAGCKVETKTPAEGDNAVAISGDGNGSVSFNLPFAKGEVALPEGMMTSANFDIDGVKLMPGSKVTGFAINAGDGGAKVTARFMSPKSVDEVKNYFLGEFAAKKVTASSSDNASFSTKDGGSKVSRITGSGKDGETFTIDLSPQGNLTQGDINIVEKDKG